MKNDNDKLDIYSKFNEDEARKFESIDRFLRLSSRFSRKNRKRSKIISTVLFWIMAVLFLGAALGTRNIGGIIGFVVFAPFVLLIWLGVNHSLNEKNFPELERVNNIIRKDGLDAVYNDLENAVPVVGKGTVSGGRYLFTEGKAMCRIENVNKVYQRYISHGRSGSYYACAEVTDETGIYQHNMVRLPMFRRDQKFEMIRQEIFRMKLSASVQDKNI